MATIRNDVIKVGFDIDTKNLTGANEALEDLQKKVTGTLKKDIDNFSKGFSGLQMPSTLQESIDNVAKGLTSLNDSLDDFQKKQSKSLPSAGSGFDALNIKAKSIGETFKDIGAKALDVTKKIAKVGAAAAASGAAIAGMLTKQAVSNFADYEQLEGGVKTLFGTDVNSIEDYADSVGKSVDEVSEQYNKLIAAQNTVFENASNAYMNAGLSANEYMDTVTSFSASLISGLGGDTQKAAQIADMAIVDMADNANKMGTNISSIQDAYQGFAKDNYTINNLMSAA